MPGTLLVPLTQGFFAIIDEADGDRVGRVRWSVVKAERTYYAKTQEPRRRRPIRRMVLLHRFLWESWGLPPSPELDHRNTNGLDCRRENLRAATGSQNGANRGVTASNTSGYKGVSWHSGIGKWVAQIAWQGKKRNLGTFSDPETAHAAYVRAARELHGEFARAA